MSHNLGCGWIFPQKNEHVRSYSIYEYDPTLIIAFGAILGGGDFDVGPPNIREIN
jgi:hypothetical protein